MHSIRQSYTKVLLPFDVFSGSAFFSNNLSSFLLRGFKLLLKLLLEDTKTKK